uniref:Uncharacterized protein n=1 Tax=Arundo donax TaxID=35708 RepID=A0A0A9BKJ4_ARUDO
MRSKIIIRYSEVTYSACHTATADDV